MFSRTDSNKPFNGCPYSQVSENFYPLLGIVGGSEGFEIERSQQKSNN